MKYTFRGQFSGLLAPGFSEALASVTVRLYKYRGTKYISSLAVADPRNTMTILPDGAISAKAHSLIAEAATDADGKFVIVLEDADYSGEAFDLDIFFTTVPGRKSLAPNKPLQISVATMKPKWEPTEEGFSTVWSYCLPDEIWHSIRAHFDAWVICGRVVAGETRTPVPSARVSAFDADWIQDDRLGESLTDDKGGFRIDYAREDFTRTPLSPLINAEDGGPDLYFKIDTASGRPLLSEPKKQGQTTGRADAGHCIFIEFTVQEPVQSPA